MSSEWCCTRSRVSLRSPRVDSPIVFPHRIENVERLRRSVQHYGAVLDVSRDAPHVARAQHLLLAADGETHAPLEKDADLLVRVAVLLDDSVRLQLDEGEHHLFRRTGADRHSGKDRVRRAFRSRREVEAHGTYLPCQKK